VSFLTQLGLVARKVEGRLSEMAFSEAKLTTHSVARASPQLPELPSSLLIGRGI
jgi:hypothetical protein